MHGLHIWWVGPGVLDAGHFCTSKVDHYKTHSNADYDGDHTYLFHSLLLVDYNNPVIV